ncbi:MAG: hypothetical protein CHACPFDD_00705 [Phycisphaerae bacterium]|nr:hypothetical protein [Phycisphaerae bacterium]
MSKTVGYRWRRGLSAAGVLIVLSTLGGCPIDRDAVVTESLRAALDAATNSIVDALTEYLANN